MGFGAAQRGHPDGERAERRDAANHQGDRARPDRRLTGGVRGGPSCGCVGVDRRGRCQSGGETSGDVCGHVRQFTRRRRVGAQVGEIAPHAVEGGGGACRLGVGAEASAQRGRRVVVEQSGLQVGQQRYRHG